MVTLAGCCSSTRTNGTAISRPATRRWRPSAWTGCLTSRLSRSGRRRCPSTAP